MPLLRAVAMALALLPLASNSSEEQANQFPAIKQIICRYTDEGGSGYHLGTAFQANGHYLSVAHVSAGNSQCTIDGKPVIPVQERKLDFTDLGPSPKGYRIDCGGFKEGEDYWAVGFAQGLPVQKIIHLTGTGVVDKPTGMAFLIGYPTVIPGMSGGPILNHEGRVVGTVNAYDTKLPFSYSQELKGTSLCPAHGR